MKNIKTTDIEIVLAYLNQVAKYFEERSSAEKEFLSISIHAIKMAESKNLLDRIQSRLLLDQAIDISKKEYTRFCDPDKDFISSPEEGFDKQGYPTEL